MPYADTPEASIYYEVHGDGPALVLAHGASGNAASWWQQVPVFAQRHKVVVFDHRLFGRSRSRPEVYGRSRFSGDLIAVLDAAGIDRAAVVGQSMGGWTGLRAAIEYPERIACLVLCSTSGGVAAPHIQHNLTAARARFVAEGFSRVALDSGFAQRRPDMAFLHAQLASLNAQLTPEVRAVIAERDDSLTPEEIRRLSAPTLLLAGENDPLFPPERMREVAYMLPGAEFAVLAGAGHSAYFEMPDAFNRIVEAFLARHRGRQEEGTP